MMDRKNYNDDGSSTGGLSKTDRNEIYEIQDHILTAVQQS